MTKQAAEFLAEFFKSLFAALVDQFKRREKDKKDLGKVEDANELARSNTSEREAGEAADKIRDAF